MSAACFLCGAKANSKFECRKCQTTNIRACSEECMNIHTNTGGNGGIGHSNDSNERCNAFIMQQNEVVGRYLVASRRIQAQEVVLVDPAIVIAPQSLPVCLVCLGMFKGQLLQIETEYETL